eukprot:TRINITY_DN2827_c0_g1_i1.p1 TRINITY_DN2827_c0_g1~~TRINITY_DN2827_c0_g1_i1.p1  ORF type:complete len:252 (+),score=43.08 TRINITY_DN2827_c0_g1_i1:3-758(+)
MCIRDSRVHGKTKTQTINFPLMQYQVSFPPVLNLLNNANLQNLMSLNHIDREYDDRRTSSTNDSDHDSAFGSMSPPSLIPANKDRQGSAQRPKNKSFLIKKKTELCKTYDLGLSCKYGDKCSFAHGVKELKAKLHIPINYKTSRCKQYHEEAYCKYGPRCQFLHKPINLEGGGLLNETHSLYLHHKVLRMNLAQIVYPEINMFEVAALVGKHEPGHKLKVFSALASNQMSSRSPTLHHSTPCTLRVQSLND